MDISKIKPGDKITVELTVKCRDIGGYFRSEGVKSINPNFVGNHIDPGDIIGHTPKPPEIVVGTKFSQVRSSVRQWTVLAVHKDYAMCHYREGTLPSVWHLSTIRKILSES